MTPAILRHILPTVTVDGRTCNCVKCGHVLGTAAASWKDGALCREQPLKIAGGPAYDTGFDGVVLRHFICPGCAVLLDTETATSADAALDDRLARTE